ncbi:hypothetical protein NDI44_26965 [Trichocoleus sp. DQ-A3]|uniref:hypothetical protein n=1 Tax=Cyanophyceae TaxID=3028117 RepID=UPI0016890AF4|nr:hypothetical protein [Coleofasciculus sp. FACHB-125]MBD1903766.1 hypothetical protein [Coleofasciculus sp. FACHB-125]
MRKRNPGNLFRVATNGKDVSHRESLSSRKNAKIQVNQIFVSQEMSRCSNLPIGCLPIEL